MSQVSRYTASEGCCRVKFVTLCVCVHVDSSLNTKRDMEEGRSLWEPCGSRM
jgi:hypothetical protein